MVVRHAVGHVQPAVTKVKGLSESRQMFFRGSWLELILRRNRVVTGRDRARAHPYHRVRVGAEISHSRIVIYDRPRRRCVASARGAAAASEGEAVSAALP